MDDTTLQARLTALSAPIAVTFAGISAMVKIGHFNLWIMLVTAAVAYLFYLVRRRQQRSNSAKRIKEIRARVAEYGPTREHFIAGEALLVVMVTAQVLGWYLFGTTAAMLAPLALLAPIYIVNGVRAPRHATDVSPSRPIPLIVASAMFAAVAVAAPFFASSPSMAIFMRGGSAFCAVMFAMVLAIVTLRRKGPFVRISD